MNTTALEKYTTEASDGYMGAIRTDGSQSHRNLYGGDLSKAIKQALQEVLTPDIKKSEIRTRCQSYSGGQNLTITLELDKSKYAPSSEEFKEIIKEKVKHFKISWIWMEKDGQPCEVFKDEYYNLNEEEAQKAQELTAEEYYKFTYNYDVEVNHYHIDDEIMLNEEGRNLVKVANRVIKSFNYDDSNSMVDYFDTNFYYTLKIEWKKEA